MIRLFLQSNEPTEEKDKICSDEEIHPLHFGIDTHPNLFAGRQDFFTVWANHGTDNQNGPLIIEFGGGNCLQNAKKQDAANSPIQG